MVGKPKGMRPHGLERREVNTKFSLEISKGMRLLGGPSPSWDVNINSDHEELELRGCGFKSFGPE